MILVLNENECSIEDLPFDLKFHRTIGYDPAKKDELVLRLKDALHTSLLASEAPIEETTSLLEPACDSVGTDTLCGPRIREFMKDLSSRLDKLAPDLGPVAGGNNDDYRNSPVSPMRPFGS